MGNFPHFADKIMTDAKEFLYVGYYIDFRNRFILKIGTTNDIDRRTKEHTRNYRKSPEYTLPPNGEFHMVWKIPLSKYNTLRYEDRNRQAWIDNQVGEFVRNDRFVCESKPATVEIKIRKIYQVAL